MNLAPLHSVLVRLASMVRKTWDARFILTQRATMGNHPTAFAQGAPEKVWAAALARFAPRTSFRGYLLASVARIGRARRLVKNLASLARAARRPRQAQPGRSLPRWQLRQRQKWKLCVGKAKRGKGTRWMVGADGACMALGSQLWSASPAEVTLAESSLARISVPRVGRGRTQSRPLRVIADRTYDSDPLRGRLPQLSIVLPCPHRRKRRRPYLNDGRTMRRYTRRWTNEHPFCRFGKLPTSPYSS